jgi:3-dehydroquinate dehydratase
MSLTKSTNYSALSNYFTNQKLFAQVYPWIIKNPKNYLHTCLALIMVVKAIVCVLEVSVDNIQKRHSKEEGLLCAENAKL